MAHVCSNLPSRDRREAGGLPDFATASFVSLIKAYAVARSVTTSATASTSPYVAKRKAP
jgi:hypothetical protein